MDRTAVVIQGTGTDPVDRTFREMLADRAGLLDPDRYETVVDRIARTITAAFAAGRKVLWMGNGGSAADAQHLAAEFSGRFLRERRGYPSEALSVNSSAVTAIANDYGYERVFARQVEAFACEGDVVVGITTSGNSSNIVAGLEEANRIGATTIAFTGNGGGRVAEVAQISLVGPSGYSALVQEVHITLGHIVCDLVDQKLVASDRPDRTFREMLADRAGLLDPDRYEAIVERLARTIAAAFVAGRKVLWMGNGGSAADAQHLAAEFSGRFLRERRGYPSEALSVNSSAVTAIANDYGYERVFARQVEAFACEGDVVVGITTSGNSKNVVLGLEEAKRARATAVAMTGNGGGRVAEVADLSLVGPSGYSALVQEVHITLGHIVCDLVEQRLIKP